jgi:hypothetical protein
VAEAIEGVAVRDVASPRVPEDADSIAAAGAFSFADEGTAGDD